MRQADDETAYCDRYRLRLDRDQARLSGGLVSLQEDGVRKVIAGITTIDEVLAATAEGSLPEAG